MTKDGGSRLCPPSSVLCPFHNHFPYASSTRVALLRLLEERLEHVHRERLAEAARAREDGDRGFPVEKSLDELRLVGRPVPGLDGGPVAVAHRERREPGAVLGVPFCHDGILSHHRVGRNCNSPGRRSTGASA